MIDELGLMVALQQIDCGDCGLVKHQESCSNNLCESSKIRNNNNKNNNSSPNSSTTQCNVISRVFQSEAMQCK